MAFKVPEKYRETGGVLASGPEHGNNGSFVIDSLKVKGILYAQASDGGGWEHVSVSRRDRCPSWNEMCFVKSLFWGDEDAVIQIHPPRSEYVNCHPRCLHLWRKAGTNDFYEAPPRWMVGI